MLKVDLVASFANVELEKPPFTMGITNKTPRYVALNPLGKVTFHYATLFYVASIKTAFCSIYPAILPGDNVRNFLFAAFFVLQASTNAQEPSHFVLPA